MKSELIIQPFEGREADLLPFFQSTLPGGLQVRQQLRDTQLYTATLEGNVTGAFALGAVDLRSMEIKALAVKPEYRRQGIGAMLLGHAVMESAVQGFEQVIIGTPNSQPNLMSYLQQNSFELINLRKNVLNRSENPVEENGIVARHLLIFAKKLQ